MPEKQQIFEFEPIKGFPYLYWKDIPIKIRINTLAFLIFIKIVNSKVCCLK
jgi:hypothetical protein